MVHPVLGLLLRVSLEKEEIIGEDHLEVERVFSLVVLNALHGDEWVTTSELHL